MNVLVYGATGTQQFPVISSLKKKGANVYATTHREKNIERLTDAGATALLADMSDKNRLDEINKGIDAVSLLIPFFLPDPEHGLGMAKNAIDAALKNNVKLIVWNTSGFILPGKIGNPALDVRIDILEYLQQSGLPFITIQPSVYAENLLGPWTAPFVANRRQVAYPTPEEMPVGWIATNDVAALVAEAIFSPPLAGKHFRVSGLENLRGNQLAEKFTIGLGERVSYYELPPKEFGAILDELFGPGAGKGAEAMYQQIHDTRQYPIMFSDNMPDVLLQLPVKMTSIENWVSQNKNAFKKT